MKIRDSGRLNISKKYVTLTWFSKSGNEQIEEAHTTHYLNIEKIKDKGTKA